LALLPLNAEHAFPQETGLNAARFLVGPRKDLAVNTTLPESFPPEFLGQKHMLQLTDQLTLNHAGSRRVLASSPQLTGLLSLESQVFTVRRNVYKLYLQDKIPCNWGRSLG